MLPDGMSRLAQVLSQRMGEQAQRPDAMELGTIRADMSLLLDRFPIPMPRGEYLICRTLTLPNPIATTSGKSVGDHGIHNHTVPRPAELRALSPGDRVLVAWVNDGTDPVIVDVVVSS
jgi:hypothetical protein